MHRLALQVQVLEESDTHAIEAEAVRRLHAVHLLCTSAYSGVASTSFHHQCIFATPGFTAVPFAGE